MQECQVDDHKHHSPGWVNMQEYRLQKNASPILQVGQHARILNAENRISHKNRVGQHAGTVGQHKQEWWVNMRRNLQYFLLIGSQETEM
jgi:hypothetical protein